jgi:hypothetical protein
MDLNNDRKVSADDLEGTLKLLSHQPGREEVESMLWEVDDDTKGFLTAADFKSSYYRIRASTEADEPRSWFRLVEFMMIDEDGDGTIAFDEAAKMFRNRYGEPLWDTTGRQLSSCLSQHVPLTNQPAVGGVCAGKTAVENVQTMFAKRAEPLGTDGAVRFKEMSYTDFLTSMATLVPEGHGRGGA